MTARKLNGQCTHCGTVYPFYKGAKYCSIECQFFSRVEKTSDCWLWTGSVGSHGYGQINVNGEICTAHRLSAKMHKGIGISDSIVLMHSCDNRRCVNPDHLIPGTRQLNQLDMAIKLRGRRSFSKKQIDYIRSQLVTGRSCLSLSKEMGCSQPTIAAIKNGKWLCYRIL